MSISLPAGAAPSARPADGRDPWILLVLLAAVEWLSGRVLDGLACAVGAIGTQLGFGIKARIVRSGYCDDLIQAFKFWFVTCCCFVLGFVTSAASGALGMHSVPLVRRQ